MINDYANFVNELIARSISKDHHVESELPRKFLLYDGENINILLNENDYIYLLDGRISFNDPLQHNRITLSDNEDLAAIYPITENDSRVLISASEDSIIYHINGDLLDDILSWEVAIHNYKHIAPMQYDYISLLVRTPLVKELQPENLVRLASSMEKIHKKSGDVIIREGDDGDAYYYILDGEATVSQVHPLEGTNGIVNKLRNGDGFGEEALVLDCKRTATVTMDCDSTLLKIAKKDYVDLISSQLISCVSAEQANDYLKEGYLLLDVRFDEEKELQGYIPHSELISLNDIRHHLNRLKSLNNKYIVYCRSGKRSKAAALLLRECGIKALSLNGGINDWPYDIEYI